MAYREMSGNTENCEREEKQKDVQAHQRHKREVAAETTRNKK